MLSFNEFCAEIIQIEKNGISVKSPAGTKVVVATDDAEVARFSYGKSSSKAPKGLAGTIVNPPFLDGPHGMSLTNGRNVSGWMVVVAFQDGTQRIMHLADLKKAD